MPVAVADLGPRFSTDKGQIRLDSPAFATDRRSQPVVRTLHDFANAVSEEPCSFHAAIEGPLYLASADPFLAGGDELDRLKPQMQGEMAVLENTADPHGKSLAAGVALAEAGAAALAGQATNALLIPIAAMRADRAFRPQMRLDIGKSGFLVVEVGDGKNGISHRKSPMASTLYLADGVAKCNVAFPKELRE
jgi:hypothetical protein